LCTHFHMNLTLLDQNHWPKVIINILLKITIIRTKIEKTSRIYYLEEEAKAMMMMNL
jgi:hypothetical protein